MTYKRIALVTGASRGIGRAIAIELARDNISIIVNYSKDQEGAGRVVEEINKNGGYAIAIKSDVGNFDDVSKMFNEIKEKFSRLDILVNNAGINRDRTLKKMSLDEWNNVIEVNLNSVYNVTKNALPLLQKDSRVINISSIVGIFGNYGQTNYAASKAGIIGFTKSLAKELGKYGITVNAIAPGFIETEMTNNVSIFKKKIIKWMTPLKRLGTPEDIANSVAFLASERAGYISGQVVNVNGGLSI